MAEEYVTLCESCSKGITKEQLKYTNGRAFHSECFEKDGNRFPAIDQDMLNKTARLKINLIQLRNLKSRTSGSGEKTTSKSTTKQKTKKKSKRKKVTKRKSKQRKSRKQTRKRKVPRGKTATKRRRIKRNPSRKRKIKRKTSRRR